MKKFLSFLLILSMISFPAYGAWDKAHPAGTDLISDIDLYVLANNTALELTTSGLHGWKNLKVVQASVKTVTVTADQLYLQAASTLAMRATTVNESIDIEVAGASGLDTGAEGNKWYYIWIIAKADGTINGLLSASSTAPTLPAGYIFYALVSAVHNTAGSFVDFTQNGNIYTYDTPITLTSGSSGGTIEAAMAERVPEPISDIAFGTTFDAGDSEASYIGNKDTVDVAASLPNQIGGGEVGPNYLFWRLKMLTADTLWVNTDAATCRIFLDGFELNKL